MSVQRRGVDVFISIHPRAGTILSGPQVTSLDRLRKDVTWSSRDAVTVGRLIAGHAGRSC